MLEHIDWTPEEDEAFDNLCVTKETAPKKSLHKQFYLIYHHDFIYGTEDILVGVITQLQLAEKYCNINRGCYYVEVDCLDKTFYEMTKGE